MIDADFADDGDETMIDRMILMLGVVATIGAGFMSVPAKAEPVGAVVAAGVVGGVFGAGLVSLSRDRDRIPDGTPTLWYGSPGRQRPVIMTSADHPGPGRKPVCDWQDRYDRRERYIGSRRICWIEAR